MNGLVLRAAYPDSASTPVDVVRVDPAVERRPRIRFRPSRPVKAAIVVCTMLCSLIARPAYADPSGDVPDTGSRPIASGQLVMPNATGATAAPPATTTDANRGPKAAELAQLELTVAQLGEKRNRASTDLDTARNALADAEVKLTEAGQRVQEQKQKADDAAAEAYKRAQQLGPLNGYANDLHQFGLLAPGLGGQPGGEEAARDLLRAQEAESAARQELQDAQTAMQTAQNTYTPIDTEFQAKNTEYVTMRAQNDQLVLQLEAEQDAAEQALSPNLVDNPIINGMQADPRARQALTYAMSKVNVAWYVWGDEGPDTFDCSGLAYWAYGKVGVTVPRVAADMYHGTHAIRPTVNSPGDQLLPGDLVYFATNMGDWRSIYHMGIYIGGGKMVNAPTSGQKVKIAEVRWSRLFGATRIFDAVPAPGQTTTAPPPANPGNTGSPSPSDYVSPTPTKGGSPSPSTLPPTSIPPSPSSSPSESPSKTPPRPSANPQSSSPAVVESSAAAGASTQATTSASASG
ncbi:NlpC/P60 family protein [Dactylosporangium sp. CS-033363]|uniref:C40 family peptidase n=1 Tax=Dactylosporangium sp. CS-033363 TaxID=3239935 RepID=UPI003D8B8338